MVHFWTLQVSSPFSYCTCDVEMCTQIIKARVFAYTAENPAGSQHTAAIQLWIEQVSDSHQCPLAWEILEITCLPFFRLKIFGETVSRVSIRLARDSGASLPPPAALDVRELNKKEERTDGRKEGKEDRGESTMERTKIKRKNKQSKVKERMKREKNLSTFFFLHYF